MAAHAITLHLPEPLYDYFRGQAKRARRSVEAEILRIVAAAAPADEMLPPDLEEEIAALQSLSDNQLRQAANARLSAAESARLESLHLQQQDTGLGNNEKAEVAELLDKYERAILIRAQAIQLLSERGHDVSELIASR